MYWVVSLRACCLTHLTGYFETGAAALTPAIMASIWCAHDSNVSGFSLSRGK